jgi:hypothetical protein
MGHRVRITASGLLVEPEASLLAQVMGYARMRGWHAWHDRATNAPRRCRECGTYRRLPRNAAGFPDLVLVRRPDIIIAELKAEGEKPTTQQTGWLNEFAACGVRAFVWRPSDWDEITRILL